MDASLEILIQIRDDLAGLTRARQGISDTKQEAEGFGKLLREGLGIGVGMQLAAQAIELLKETLIDTTKRAFEFADQIENGSKQLNISTDSWQVLRFALRDAGMDMSQLNIAYAQQTRTMADARDIASNAATAYRTLGLDINKLEGMSFDQRLLMIVRATTNAKDQTVAFQAAAQILGTRGLPQLLAALRPVSEEYDKLAASLKASGQIMDEDTAERLEHAKMTWEHVGNWITVQSAELIDALLNPLQNTPAAILEAAAARAAAEAGKNRGAVSAPLPLQQTVAWREKELELMRAGDDVASIQSDTLNEEAAKRTALNKALQTEIGLLQQELKLAQTTPLTPGENMYDRDKVIEQLSAKIDQLQHQKNALIQDTGGIDARGKKYHGINNPDVNGDYLTPGQGVVAGMQDFVIGIGSTGQMVSQTLQQSLGSAVSTLSSDIWDATKRTKNWGDAFRDLADIAGRMLTEMLIKMLLVKGVEMTIGWFGGTSSAGTVTSTSMPAEGGLFGGGGTFLTKGPTNITVGDNPGGVELVNVTPISGIGQSTVNGHALAMAGGGSALVMGGSKSSAGGGDIIMNQTLNFGGGVSQQDLLSAIPQIVAASKAAVLDAQRRKRDGFR